MRVFYIDVALMKYKEAVNLFETLNILRKYKLQSPALLEAYSNKIVCDKKSEWDSLFS